MGRYIKLEVWRSLLNKSGNICAFPDCNQVLVDADDIIIGQMAHIEAYSPGGPRYNPNQSDDERNEYSNLIYLCPNHHTIIDKKEHVYTVDVLKNMKLNHEQSVKDKKCTFDFNRIYEKNIELQQFLEVIENENKKNDSGLRIEIYKDEPFENLAEKLCKNIDWIEETSTKFLQFSENLNDQIIEEMQRLEIDESKWKNIPYYENKFFNPFWEKLAIGYGSIIKESRLKIKIMELLYYSEYLKYNPNTEVQKRLEEVKKQLMEIASTISYND